jgi:uncharacterized protein (TIGR02328 family)
MRLWHKDLIKVLPREQLIAQWRELSAIAGNINEKGTPNHILVNKVMDYGLWNFTSYAHHVRAEMTERGYKTMNKVWDKICSVDDEYDDTIYPIDCLYCGWHNDRYFEQCYHNLQEKYDCGGIREEDWSKIQSLYLKRGGGF